MTGKVAKDHPRQQLLFFVSQDINDASRSSLKAFVQELRSHRRWLLGPPKFVNHRDVARSDQDVETVGGCLEIYSGMPAGSLAADIDRIHLEEVSTLVEAIQKFSAQHGLSFEFELDDNFVGSIRDGKANRSLSEGLLGQWRKHIDTKRDE